MSIYYAKIKEVIRETIVEYWKPYGEMEENIRKKLASYGIDIKNVFCTGELTNIFVYLQVDNDAYVYNSKSDFENALLLKEKNISDGKLISAEFMLLSATDLKLEIIPKIILVNLCVLQNFAIPRFNLSISTISAYIRQYQRARVYLIDMQLRVSIEDILDKINVIHPDIIGISISFGQMEISERLIDQIQEFTNNPPLIVVGNIIPSLNKETYLKKFNNIVISYSEGEKTFIDLIDYLKGLKSIHEVRGIAYFDVAKLYRVTSKPDFVEMEKLPFPSLDTLEELVKYKGALTIETSRGCNYSKCSFCPREHKGACWRALSVPKMLSYFSILYDITRRFNIPASLYIADEEFIGQLPHELERDRIMNFCQQIEEREIHLNFDISARVDSIYRPDESRENNIERLKMWLSLKNIGLNRLFLGVESGSDAQLLRFNKGTTAAQNKIALRLITALGINIRIGYITFDPLMQTFTDLEENHFFVEQTDVLHISENIEYGDISGVYDSIVSGSYFSKVRLQNKPLFSKISYPLTSLEIFFNTKYLLDVKKYESEHNVRLVFDYDMNMARYRTEYVNKSIGLMSKYCQIWIDHNFSVLYALKGLYKTADLEEKELIYSLMEKYKILDHYLLSMMLFQINGISNDSVYNSLIRFMNVSKERMPELHGNDEEKLISILNIWENMEERQVINPITVHLQNGELTDTIDYALNNAIQIWYKNKSIWKKINN